MIDSVAVPKVPVIEIELLGLPWSYWRKVDIIVFLPLFS